MNEIYLNRVLIYLQQELPSRREQLRVIGGKIEINLAATEPFQPAFEHLQQTIADSIGRVRNREIDLEFTVKTAVQERDFKILK